MDKEKYLKAIDDLYNEYDAYYFVNKYDGLENNTHREQFELLADLLVKDYPMAGSALSWIKNCYDCYYKEQYLNDDESPFSYLKSAVNKKLGGNNDN